MNIANATVSHMATFSSNGLRRLLVISCDIRFDLVLHCILILVFASQPLLDSNSGTRGTFVILIVVNRYQIRAGRSQVDLGLGLRR